MSGGGNIKVVVRCRPLNARGAFSLLTKRRRKKLNSTANNCCAKNLHAAPVVLSVWRATRPSYANRTETKATSRHSHSINRIGRQIRMTQTMQIRTEFTMIWVSSCWTTPLTDTTAVFLHVRSPWKPAGWLATEIY